AEGPTPTHYPTESAKKKKKPTKLALLILTRRRAKKTTSIPGFFMVKLTQKKTHRSVPPLCVFKKLPWGRLY
ncbi:hypothetical protein, partial [Enterobacter asburiae]